MGLGVAAGAHDRGAAVVGAAEEHVRGAGRPAPVDGHLHVTVGGVLEADRHRQARRQLPVHLALGGARPDGAPGDGVRDVLRADGLEELAAHRQALVEYVQQQRTGRAQPARHIERLVQPRIVDQALPPGGGARLLEVHAHHHQHVVADLLGHGGQAAGVVAGRVRVVHRAGAHHQQDPVVGAVEDAGDLLAAALDQPGAVRTQRVLGDELARGGQVVEARDVPVGGAAGGGVEDGGHGVGLSVGLRLRCGAGPVRESGPETPRATRKAETVGLCLGLRMWKLISVRDQRPHPEPW